MVLCVHKCDDTDTSWSAYKEELPIESIIACQQYMKLHVHFDIIYHFDNDVPVRTVTLYQTSDVK